VLIHSYNRNINFQNKNIKMVFLHRCFNMTMQLEHKILQMIPIPRHHINIALLTSHAKFQKSNFCFVPFKISTEVCWNWFPTRRPPMSHSRGPAFPNFRRPRVGADQVQGRHRHAGLPGKGRGVILELVVRVGRLQRGRIFNFVKCYKFHYIIFLKWLI
jgi:hypothetical protein